MSSLWLDRERQTFSDELPVDGRVDDLVVGAGLTGLVTALLLARAGRHVAVLEARHIGAAASGNTTAKVSLLQGTTLSTSVKRQPSEVQEAYVDANREGMEWLLGFCDDHGVDYQRRAAITYAASPSDVPRVHDEHRAARSLGLPTRLIDAMDVPFPLFGATVLDDQAQFDPWEVLVALAGQVREHGGTVHEGERVVSVSKSGAPVVRLESGRDLICENVILATGTPILDRGLHFARLEPQRSYALAFRHAAPPPAMYLSAGSNSRSIRDTLTDGAPRLLVGGAGHTVGRTRATSEHVEDLRRWTSLYFPEAEETHPWSAQDYAAHTGVPLVGRLPLNDGHTYADTGFAKWGMTNGVAAAIALSGAILGDNAADAAGSKLRAGALIELARMNTAVGTSLVAGYLRVVTDAAGVRRRRTPQSAPRWRVCTHLGGPLVWNDEEASWDCTLHGSRFGADGAVLEGPATRPLCSRYAD